MAFLDAASASSAVAFAVGDSPAAAAASVAPSVFVASSSAAVGPFVLVAAVVVVDAVAVHYALVAAEIVVAAVPSVLVAAVVVAAVVVAAVELMACLAADLEGQELEIVADSGFLLKPGALVPSVQTVPTLHSVRLLLLIQMEFGVLVLLVLLTLS